MGQALEALQMAQAARLAAAEVKREVREGHLGIALALNDERARPIKVVTLLSLMHLWGPTKARKLMFRARIPQTNKRVDQLTRDEHDRLHALLVEIDRERGLTDETGD